MDGAINMSTHHKTANTPDVAAHRELSPDEERALETGKSRWLPRIFQSYGTPIPELMASPLKTGLIFGVPAGLIGAGLGSAIGGAAHGANGKGYSGMGALLGGLGAGGLAALAAGMDREAKNEGLEELMRRMPEGAAKRDLLADPQYQADFLGWDNNKIVATARARYYRPTERFSKRTEDMRDARARYNERNKTSSVNKDVSMSKNEPRTHFVATPAAQAARTLLENNNLTLSEKMAQYKALLQKQAYDSPTMGASIPPMAGPAMSPPPGFDPSNMKMPVSPTTGLPINNPDAPALPSKPAAPKYTGSADMGDYTGVGKIVDSEFLKHLFGVGDRRSTLYDKTFAPIGRGISSGLGATGDFLGSMGSAGLNAGKSFGKWLKPDAPPPPTLLEQLKPYAPAAAIGAGGLGAIALADYLSRRNKKKKRPQQTEDEDAGEYSMPKAANVNWYALARHRQKQANALSLARTGTGLIPYSRVGAGLSHLRSMLRGAAPYVDPFNKKSLPFYAGSLFGGVNEATGGFGVRPAIASMFKGKDPSMLQQVMNSKYTPYAAAGLAGAGLLGGAAYMGNRAGKNDAKKKKKPEGKNEKQSNLGGAGLGAGAGAGLGGLAGGLYGALAPGYEEDPMTGRRRRRSRLTAALRGLAGGAALGGLGGGAAGYFAGDKNIKSVLEKFLANKSQDAGPDAAAGIRTDATMQPDPVEVAKQEASQPPPASASPAIPQGPQDANATMGGQPAAPMAPPAMSMPPQSPAPPAGVPQSPVIPQGPQTASATMGAMPQQQPMM